MVRKSSKGSYDLVMEVQGCHFHCILLVKYIQGKGLCLMKWGGVQAEGGEELKAASLEASYHSHHMGQSRLHGCVTRDVVPGPTVRRVLYLAQCSAVLILTILIIFKKVLKFLTSSAIFSFCTEAFPVRYLVSSGTCCERYEPRGEGWDLGQTLCSAVGPSAYGELADHLRTQETQMHWN